ncbi:hypothetical protein PspLS_10049 [Pyricularia sp. CBS 133598]|nr:hypothetical protein PspLS_10049 [Pyricularia sp. CBS 133598]
MGLPCAHVLKDLTDANLVLRLEHFHSQWHLKRSGSPPFLLEPRQRITAISAKSTAPQSSTRREPSGQNLHNQNLRNQQFPIQLQAHHCDTATHELFTTDTLQQETLDIKISPEEVLKLINNTDPETGQRRK